MGVHIHPPHPVFASLPPPPTKNKRQTQTQKTLEVIARLKHTSAAALMAEMQQREARGEVVEGACVRSVGMVGWLIGVLSERPGGWYGSESFLPASNHNTHTPPKHRGEPRASAVLAGVPPGEGCPLQHGRGPQQLPPPPLLALPAPPGRVVRLDWCVCVCVCACACKGWVSDTTDGRNDSPVESSPTTHNRNKPQPPPSNPQNNPHAQINNPPPTGPPPRCPSIWPR